MRKDTPPILTRLSDAKQRRLNRLLDKNSEGTITSSEKNILEKLVAEAEQTMVANAKLLAEFADSQPAGTRKDAVPVTIWVSPEQARR